MKRSSGMNTKVNGRLWTLCGVALILVGAVAVNLIVNRDKAADADSVQASAQTGQPAATAQKGFFESFRMERDETREQEIAYIDTIIVQGADAETMADAQQQKLAIVDAMEKEMTIESLLRAKGFADAAVTLHAGAVNVVLQAETLSPEQVAQVLDIIVRETGEKTDNIKITTAQ